ncbi:MAG TPA: MlaD family protein, partial [Gemmatimonadales bacterium]|nr:MlaD family protein [Gemmatimonadales bacterium]
AGDPVLVSGVKKGRVATVELAGVGRVRVVLEISKDVAPHVDASATIGQLDFFGAKYVDYSPGGQEALLPAGRAIVGASPPGLADMASGLATRANELLGRASGLVSDQLATDLHNTLVATQRGMDVLVATGNGPMVKQTTATLASVERVMSHLDTLLGSQAARQTGVHLDTLTTNLAVLSTNLSHATASLDTLLAAMNHGQGSLGKMATDSMLYVDLKHTLESLSALLDDLRERPGRYLTVKVF